MAKQKQKEPGRIAQIVDVFKRTIEIDRSALWWIIVGFVAPTAAGITLAAVLNAGVFGWILWTLLGLTFGLMVAMIILGRKAEKAAYLSLDGRPGAVSAVLKAPLKRQFRGSDEPIAINPRSYSAVYRVVGGPGVVFIAEGNRSDAQTLLEKERKRAQKAASGAPIHAIWVTGDNHATPLRDVVKTMNKMKRVLTRAQIKSVNDRLNALGNPLPIPKGMDPRKMRAARR